MDQFSVSPQLGLPASVLSVSEISEIISEALDDDQLHDIWVRGEISGYKPHQSGHYYFSLSEQAHGKTFVIECIMWQSRGHTLDFEFQNGLAVITFGYVQFHGPSGRLKLYAQEMYRVGEGEKHLLVERWKKELEAEGLFAEERKKPLPQFPTRVGVVTSPTGAVLQDIKNILTRRYPVEIVLSPTAVQGDMVHLEIAAAIRKLDGKVNVIIVGRGGGSFEDLFPFNHPDVVRAIANCTTPVISAVGHETDFVLADFAADQRASTPSVAAELVVPDRLELAREMKDYNERMRISLETKVQSAIELIEELRLRLQPRRIKRRIDEKREEIAEREENMERAILAKIEQSRSILHGQKAILEERNPLTILSRGYCIAEKEGRVVRSAKDLRTGDRIRLRMAGGGAGARIEEVYHDEEV